MRTLTPAADAALAATITRPIALIEIGFAPTQSLLPVSSPYALSTSLGFGGGNAALVLGRATA